MNRKRKHSKRRKTFTGGKALISSRKRSDAERANREPDLKYSNSTAVEGGKAKQLSATYIRETTYYEYGRQVDIAECKDTDYRSHSETVYVQFYNNRETRFKIEKTAQANNYTLQGGFHELFPSGKDCSAIGVVAIPGGLLPYLRNHIEVLAVTLSLRPEGNGSYQIRSRKYDKTEKVPSDQPHR